VGPGKKLPALGQKSSDPDGNILRDSAFCLAAVLLGSLSFVAAIDVIMSKIRCKFPAAHVANMLRHANCTPSP
jgi:hypothetical protein